MFCLLAGAVRVAIGSSVLYGSFRTAGYYPDYYYEELSASQIRYDKLTDIIYFSIYPNSDGSLNLSEINLTHQQELVRAARLNYVKTAVCVGGWGLSQNFSHVAADPSIRAAFVHNLVQYCLTYGLDGIDLDWEPVWDSADKRNYTALIQELKTAMIPHSLTLSVAVSAQGSEFGSEAIDSIDWLHVMAYDMGTPHSSYDAALAALAHWESLGLGRSKIVLGLPFYGKDADGKPYPYKTINSLYAPKPEMDEIAGINFNGVNTIKAKIRYALENGYGGVMFWELTNDSADQTSLLNAIAEVVHFSRVSAFNGGNVIDVMDLDRLIRQWLMVECDREKHLIYNQPRSSGDPGTPKNLQTVN